MYDFANGTADGMLGRIAGLHWERNERAMQSILEKACRVSRRVRFIVIYVPGVWRRGDCRMADVAFAIFSSCSREPARWVLFASGIWYTPFRENRVDADGGIQPEPLRRNSEPPAVTSRQNSSLRK